MLGVLSSITKKTLIRLFGKPKTRRYDLRSFEKATYKLQKGHRKQREKAKGILTPAKLRKRRELTRGGKQELVLKLGRDGEPESYTLQELDKMAKAIEKKRGKYKDSRKGVPVAELVRASRVPVNIIGKRLGMTDITKSKRIGRATLYKFVEDILHFRVVSSNGKDLYRTRVRLEDWQEEMVAGVSRTYLMSAQMVCSGNVSIDCTCGRFQYWFRYLAGVGGFCVTPPAETGFPKIRNPNMIGCACKHILKCLAVMQNPIVHNQLVREMERQARKKSWLSRKTGIGLKKRMSDADIELLDEAGKQDVDEAFKQFQQAQKGFKKKMAEPATKRKLKESQIAGKTYRELAKQEKARADRLSEDLVKSKLGEHIALAVYRDKQTKDQALKSFAKKHDVPLKAVKKIAKGANLL